MIGLFAITGSGGGDDEDDETENGNENGNGSTVVQQWTWISGDNRVNESGTYGTKGTADASNIPGARYGSCSWIDSDGDLWLFGGDGFDKDSSANGYLNDLWEYDISSGQWTWISGSDTGEQSGSYGTIGISDASNIPGARSYAISWMDSSGNLWLFGGFGYGSSDTSGFLNDLWKFSPASGQWTWVSGSDLLDESGTYGEKGVAGASNVPGGRDTSISWIDSSGNLWLFGGYGYDKDGEQDDSLNDLWMFDPNTSQWTWVSGYDTIAQPGVYGEQGATGSSYYPGARDSGISWRDSSGNVWIFGGSGYDKDTNFGYLNDLWKYNPTTKEWTWVSGSNTTDQSGTYGTMGTAAASNTPGSRHYIVSWIDSSNDLWLFGGLGFDASSSNDEELNDLWKFDTSSGQWTWVSGSNTIGQSGTYGTMGTAAESNVPGARDSGVSWIDSSDNLWIFGGVGYDGTGTSGKLNDLWQFEP